MKKFFMKKFALSEKGASDLIRAIISCSLNDIALMLPMIIFYKFLGEALDLLDGKELNLNLVLYIVLCLGATAILAIAFDFRYRSTMIASYQESANLRIRIAERLRKLPLSFFAKKDLSDLTTTIMTDCTGIETAFSHYIPQLIGAVFSFIIVSIGLFFLDVKMALAAIWVVPIAFLLIVLSFSVQDRYNKRLLNAKLELSNNIQECIEAIQDIQSNNCCDEYSKKLFGKISNVEKNSVGGELISGIFVVGAQMFVRLGIASVTIAGIKMFTNGKISLLTFIIFLIAASRIYDPLSVAFANLTNLYNTMLRCKRINNLEEQKIYTGTEVFEPKNHSICFQNVSFSYSEDEKEGVLKNVSFTAEQGEVTALIGPSGSGKSTVSKLAARFWDVESGKISIGGVDISTVDPETLLKKFSIVFQDVVLFNTSIMENIRIGNRNASDEEVIRAAEAAQCGEFVDRFKDGYNTIIGENGCRLSGGERQRISIARAFLKDAPIILLDEASASLDVENETAIQTALSRLIKNKTVLVIAHRMRTVSGADKIVVLSDGGVKESGKPSELMKQNGIFTQMVKAQTEVSQM